MSFLLPKLSSTLRRPCSITRASKHGWFRVMIVNVVSESVAAAENLLELQILRPLLNWMLLGWGLATSTLISSPGDTHEIRLYKVLTIAFSAQVLLHPLGGFLFLSQLLPKGCGQAILPYSDVHAVSQVCR